MFNAFPLDMSQYGRLFNSTRVPMREKDQLKTVKNNRQILVIRNGNIFLFDAIKEDGMLFIYLFLFSVTDENIKFSALQTTNFSTFRPRNLSGKNFRDCDCNM